MAGSKKKFEGELAKLIVWKGHTPDFRRTLAFGDLPPLIATSATGSAGPSEARIWRINLQTTFALAVPL
jgi:hypothetical protein